jgi:hypothetical protein
VALRNSTFFRAVSLIAGAVGMLPLHLMQQDEDGGNKRKARQHPLFRVLHKRPNGSRRPSSSRPTAERRPDGRQRLRLCGAIGPPGDRPGADAAALDHAAADADLMDVEFVYNRPSGGQRDAVVAGSVPLPPPGDAGRHQRRVAAAGWRPTRSASPRSRSGRRGKLFKNGSFAPGTLETDKNLGDEVHKPPQGRLGRALQRRRQCRELADPGGRAEGEASGRTLEGSQHLETRQHEAEEIARFTGAPRPLLMFDETSWGSGIEQLGQMFVTYCLMPWFVAWEQAVERILEPDEEDRSMPSSTPARCCAGR